MNLNQNREYEWDKGHTTTQAILGTQPPNHKGSATKLGLMGTTLV